MSNRAHRGRCFRANRRTARRKAKQVHEEAYVAHPIRWKVPEAIGAFLFGAANQVRARFGQMASAIVRYRDWQEKTGKGAPVRAAGEAT